MSEKPDNEPPGEGWRRKSDLVKRPVESQRGRFAISISLSLVLLVLVIFLLPLSTFAGVSFAAVGGFQASIQELEGTDVSIYPTTGSTAACIDTADYSSNTDPQPGDRSFAMIQAEIGGGQIPNGSSITITKDIGLPEIMDSVPAAARIKMTNEPLAGETETRQITLGDVQFDASSLKARTMTMETNVTLDDRQSATKFADRTPTRGAQRSDVGEFILTGKTAFLQDARGQVHLLAFETMNFPGLAMTVEFVQDKADANIADPSATCNVSDPAVHAHLENFSHVVNESNQVQVEVSATNPGLPSQTQSATLDFYVEGSLINSRSVTLDGDQTTTETFSWDTTGQSPGPYEFWVESDNGVNTIHQNTSVWGFQITGHCVYADGGSTSGDCGTIDEGHTNDFWLYVENPSRAQYITMEVQCHLASSWSECGNLATTTSRWVGEGAWVLVGSKSVSCGEYSSTYGSSIDYTGYPVDSPTGQATTSLSITQNGGWYAACSK